MNGIGLGAEQDIQSEFGNEVYRISKFNRAIWLIDGSARRFLLCGLR
jgi:hypothetical protein